jgi:peptidoglycan/LPS O-acetylase OafA/YrhL
MQSAPLYCRGLDGLRGLAALMVLTSHASGMGLHLLPGLDLTGIGKPGVYLFFVISAFLLTQQWLAVPLQTAKLRQFGVRYLARRVLRIYPLYGLVLILAWCIQPHGLGVPINSNSLWRHLALFEGHGIYWSIPVEFQYYLLIPLVALAWSLSGTWRLLALGAFAAALFYVQLRFPSAEAPSGSAELVYYLPVLLAGSLAALCFASVPAAAGRPTRWLDCLLALLLAGSVPRALQALGWIASDEALHRCFWTWGFLWAAVVLALCKGWLPGWHWLLTQHFWVLCGRCCLGLYLLHLPVLLVVHRLPLPEILRAWLVLALSVLLAMASYRWIERPALALARTG